MLPSAKPWDTEWCREQAEKRKKESEQYKQELLTKSAQQIAKERIEQARSKVKPNEFY